MPIFYIISLLTQAGIYIMLALSFNLALGMTGIINLGHIAFFGVGAYTSTLLYLELGIPILIAIPMGGLMASLLSLVLMFACRRLKGDYLALATLSFHFVIYSIFLNFETLTNGPRGIIVKRPGWLNNEITFFVFVGILTIGVVALILKVRRSPFGTLLGAVRDDESLVRSLGKDSQMLKLKALALSTFIAGVSGGVMALFLRYIYPDFFYIHELVAILIIVIMGGLASVRGTIVASFIVVFLPEILRFVDLPTSIIGPVRQMLYSGVLIAILLVNSRGLFGKVDLH